MVLLPHAHYVPHPLDAITKEARAMKMPDIIMCEGKDCPIKERCYLYRATPCEQRQAYFTEIPYKDGNCDYFSNVGQRKILKSEEEND